MESNPGTYGYKPLSGDKSEIRLIRLHPSDDEAASVKCSLIHASFDDTSTPYEALSYTWDGNFFSKILILDNVNFPITENLEAALRTLRQQEKDRYLWVDAICIDQKNVTERNREVLRMLQIYQKAQKVLVWLGPDQISTHLAVEHLRDLARQWVPFEEWQRQTLALRALAYFHALTVFIKLMALTIYEQIRLQWSDLLVLIFTYLNFRSGGFFGAGIINWLFSAWSIYKVINSIWWLSQGLFLSLDLAATELAREASPGDEILIPLTDLFGRKWFSRVWIIQEVAAAREAVVICGPHEMAWETLRKACLQLQHISTGSWARSPYAHTGYQRLANIIATLETTDDKIVVPQLRSRSLFLLLSMFTTSEATVKHDKVYGLLGLSDEIQNQVPGVPLFQVDYGEAIQLVYTKVAKFIIESTGNLRVLRGCLGSRPLQGLPSWAPDWSTTALRDTEHMSELYTLPAALEGSAKETPVAVFSDDLTTLTVQGFAIAYLSEKLPETTLHDTDNDRLILHVMERMMFPVLHLLLRTSVAWWIYTQIFKLAVHFYPDEREAWSEIFDFWRDTHTRRASPFKDLHKVTLDKDITDIKYHEPAICKPFTIVPGPGFRFLELTFFITFALDPRRHDFICLLRGCDIPMVLRQVLVNNEDVDQWELVGPAPFNLPPELLWEKCLERYKTGDQILRTFNIK